MRRKSLPKNRKARRSMVRTRLWTHWFTEGAWESLPQSVRRRRLILES
ncbi:MAG TPA: hypothetical protein VHB77_22390 [Planctomycetaceae bacterium]|nr:hypothetical protein [Planctomycetaceae bacterium]